MAVMLLLDYLWPGNVRELANRMERLVLLGDEDELIEDLTQNTVNSQGIAS